ncbi:MAG TPA: hypothetical protein PK581_05440 [Caldisericia bacterium]|mgnify:CR=1 FL=1|jgi:hypothetical protein|nr:hypothetical protein [Caldisericia bacterium]
MNTNTNTPPLEICEECRKLINELVDHRLSYDAKLAFMQRISKCKREKNCYICIDLVKSFFTLRKKIQGIKTDVRAPDWLMQKILEKIQ